MNVRVLGAVLLATGIIVLAVGGHLWLRGVADDGRYHVQAASPLELIAKNRRLIDRRNAAHMPLFVGSVVSVIAVAIFVSANDRVPPEM